VKRLGKNIVTYEKDSYHEAFKHRRSGCQRCDVTIVDLVYPKRNGNNNKEHRELDDNRENKDDAVSSTDSQRRANPFESLPSERLSISGRMSDQY
jgi:hypothetical protein